MNGPSGDARTAAIASRDRKAARSETSDCGERRPSISRSPSAFDAPADGLLGAAQGKNDAGRARGAPAVPVYGALDLGTNNCRLLVARPSRRGFLVIDAFSRIIRLGEGVLRSGRLSDAAMSRTIDALKVCADKMRRRGVTRSRLIATEACRIAANSGEFIDRVRARDRTRDRDRDRETEAKLAVSGCASLIDRNCDWALVFDIGGGSSELIWLDLTRLARPWRRTLLRPARRAELHRRLDLAADRRGHSRRAPWRPRGHAARLRGHGRRRDGGRSSFEGAAPLRRAASPSVRAFPRHLRHRHHHRRHSSRPSGYDRSPRRRLLAQRPRRAHACPTSLIGMTYAERVAQPCIGHERADLVLAGCAILEALLRIWPCQRLRVADRGLREGILATLMAEDGHGGAPHSATSLAAAARAAARLPRGLRW